MSYNKTATSAYIILCLDLIKKYNTIQENMVITYEST